MKRFVKVASSVSLFAKPVSTEDTFATRFGVGSMPCSACVQSEMDKAELAEAPLQRLRALRFWSTMARPWLGPKTACCSP